jgi:hypothetical protein
MKIRIMRKFNKISFNHTNCGHYFESKEKLIKDFLNYVLPNEILFSINETVNKTLLITLKLRDNPDIVHNIEITQNESCLYTIQAELQNFGKNVRSWILLQEDEKFIEFII